MEELMVDKQLEDKFHIPSVSDSLLSRPHLFRKLDDALEGKLIVVSAQAGFGKTAVVSDWIHQRGIPSKWISLDEADNDLVRFLRNWMSSVWDRKMAATDSGSSVESMLTFIINQLNDTSGSLLFVFDDYQVIQTPAVHQAIEYFLQHMPAHIHLAIISREVLPLRLSSLRLSGEVVKIGSNHLRFMPQETVHLFKCTFGFDLSEDDLKQLHSYTKGWIGGIHLLASLSDGRPISRFIRTTENNKHEIDDLSEEVFQSQSEDVKRFLMQTSILKRLNSSLCSAVTGNKSVDILEKLDRANLVTMIRREGSWFYYHPLFTDFLRKRSIREFGIGMADFHYKAGRWFEENGFPHEAIEHGLKGEDLGTAERLVDKYAPELLRRGERVTLQRWLSCFPDKAIEERWRLAVIRGWILAFSGQYDEAVQCLKRPKNDDRLFHTEKTIIEAYIAIGQKDPQRAFRLFQSATDHSTVNSRYFQKGIDLNLGEIQVIQGRLGMGGSLKKTNELYPQLRSLWKHSGLGILGYGSVIMAELFFETNQQEKVMYFVMRGIELGRQHENIGVLMSIYIVYMRLKIAEGRMRELWSIYENARKEVEQSDASFRWMPILRAFELRLMLKDTKPDISVVDDWISSCGVHADEPPVLTREFESLTFVRALLFRKRYTQAQLLLGNWLCEARRTDKIGTKIEVLILQALILQKRGSLQKGLDHLYEALHIAEPEGYVRTFIDEGRPLAELLFAALDKSHQLRKNPQLTVYVKKLLDLFEKELGFMYWSHSNQALVEPLTQRELEILQCMSDGHDNSVIAKRLGIKIGTVKGYVVHINGKLGVQSRLQAVAKAWEQGLIVR